MPKGFITLKAKREQLASFQISHILKIEDIQDKQAHVYLTGRLNPDQVFHTRAEIESLIEAAQEGE